MLRHILVSHRYLRVLTSLKYFCKEEVNYYQLNEEFQELEYIRTLILIGMKNMGYTIATEHLRLFSYIITEQREWQSVFADLKFTGIK